MINKLKKIYRILFPKKYSPLEAMNMKLNTRKKIKSISELGSSFKVVFHNDTSVIVRNTNHSDGDVFKQIFNEQEYQLIKKLFLLNNNFQSSKIIIDAGANVGYTSFYFATAFPESKIFAIEPSQENAKQFLLNMASLTKPQSIKLYQNALCHISGTYFNIENDFRDGKDWSLSTVENKQGAIKGITIQEIIDQNSLAHISLLKIDIEGAERFIFKKENNLNFLKITEVIAIEIHDEYDIRDVINQILQDNNFMIFESGELTVGINRNFSK